MVKPCCCWATGHSRARCSVLRVGGIPGERTDYAAVPVPRPQFPVNHDRSNRYWCRDVWRDRVHAHLLTNVGGYTASVAGLLMFPMMAALLVTSVSTGVLMSRTGRYKWFPVVGSVLVAIGLVWVSTVTVESSLLVICGAMAVIGMGLGMSMQVLTIIVQNSFPLTVVGTATAATNYFRQVGATLGSAIVGSLFASRLVSTLTQAKSGVGDAPGSGGIDGGVEVSSLTPAVVNTLPDAVADVIRSAYNEALMPIYLSLVPLAVLAAVTLCFVREKPLARSLDDARAIVVGKSDRG